MNTTFSEEDKQADEISLKRVLYLLQAGNIEENACYLLNYAVQVIIFFSEFGNPWGKVTSLKINCFPFCRQSSFSCDHKKEW